MQLKLNTHVALSMKAIRYEIAFPHHSQYVGLNENDSSQPTNNMSRILATITNICKEEFYNEKI
jgi:hypothetical protein